MFDFRNCKELVDWADMVLVYWIRYNAKKYDSFQDMVDGIDAIPLGFSDYTSAFEAFVWAARTSEDVWDIMKDILLEYGKIDFGLMVDRMYRQFLLRCIICDADGYKRIWSKYHG